MTLRACMVTGAAVFAAAWVCLAARPTPPAPPQVVAEKQTSINFVVVFDFTTIGEDSNAGAALADSVRLRLARHEDCVVVDATTTQQFPPPPFNADLHHVKAEMAKLAVNVALWGTVRKTENSTAAAIRFIDLRNTSISREWTRTFFDNTERAQGEIARQIVEVLLGKEEAKPPQQGDQTEPNDFGQPLNVNGDFEQGYRGWEAPDRVSTFLVAGPAEPATANRSEAGRGQVLKIRTDLARDPWLEYRRKLLFHQADPNHPPEIPKDTSYRSVAGMEGVHYGSDWIPAKAGQRYWLTADVKGPRTDGAFPKIFVKGFQDTSGTADGLPEQSLVERKLTPKTFAALPKARQKALIAEDAKAHPDRYRREVYRWYLPCRNSSGDWTHQAGVFPRAAACPPTSSGCKSRCTPTGRRGNTSSTTFSSTPIRVSKLFDRKTR